MNINIPQLLEQGEGVSLEFKRAGNKLPESLFETICAFLNRNGGIILLGVTDDKTIEGVDRTAVDSMVKNLANLSNNPQKLFPSFLLQSTLVEYQGKLLIHVFVPASSQVYRCNGKVFDRSTDGDFELKTNEQIKNSYIRKNTLYSENTVYPFLFETDFVPGLLDRVRRIIKINRPDHPWNELSNQDFYTTAGLYRTDLATGNQGFTLAALLLFGKEEVIQSGIPHYKIDALVRKIDMDRYDDRVNIRCNLIEAYDKLMDFIAKHLPDKFYLQGDQRISLREKIFREIVVNMLIHREYTNAFPTSLIIYQHTLETKNANKPHLYGQLLPDTFEPYPKNPHLAQIFTQMGRSEELGTGLRNVFKYSKAYSGSDKVSFLEEDIFVVKVPLTSNDQINDVVDKVGDKVGEKVGDKVGDKVGEKLTDNQLKILETISLNPSISASDMAKIINISTRKIEVNISKLKSKGLLVRVGSDRGGRWEITVTN